MFIALGLGIVSGLRTFTGPAAVLLARGAPAGYVLAIFAAGEYVADILPATPSRTSLGPALARIASGAVVGRMLAPPRRVGAGMLLGAAGALIGTFGGHAARMAAIRRIGPIPAALAEDVTAIGLAAFLLKR